MIEVLAKEPLPVAVLARRYEISLSAVSQHLKVLVDAGLARCEKVGRVRTCRVEPAGIDSIDNWVAERRNAMSRKLDRLDGYLAGERNPPQ